MPAKSELKVKLLDSKARSPRRGTDSAAGYDLFALEDHQLGPGGFCKVRTGVSVELPSGTFGLITARSSAFSKGLLIQGVIDSDYTGEIYLMVHNLNPLPFQLEAGKSYAQMIVLKHEAMGVSLVNDLAKTKRGSAGFGSTGNN